MIAESVGAIAVGGGLATLLVRRAQTDKVRGLAEAARRLALPPSAFHAFGDQRNDLGMFGWAGAATCPLNAAAAAKALATEVSELSNDDDFIAASLERRRPGGCDDCAKV